MKEFEEMFSIRDASKWASNYLNKQVTTANIAYLINYGKITKIGNNGSTLVSKKELLSYYQSFNGKRAEDWKDKLGDDLNWALSFDNLKEAETTKHVHRLHPYKGKFIPQLVEYFLDSHTDQFKKEIYFKPGDVILDPFCGSGTTLVEANELRMHAIGIDVSAFNALISNCKVQKYNLVNLSREINVITEKLKNYISESTTISFENELLEELKIFNDKYFPVPEYKYKVQRGQIDEEKFGNEKALEFLPVYEKLVEKYHIELLQPSTDSFLSKWFTKHIRREIDFVYNEIKKVQDKSIRQILSVILIRTMRSCRATTHADLATLKEPVITTYYCAKHGKICKPLFSILKWWTSYSKDTITRLGEFEKIRTKTSQYCLTGDSRTVNIPEVLTKENEAMSKSLVSNGGINGIFSSPPYVGLIDYHEQHAYAYDLFGFDRKDDLEIGPLYKGHGKEAQDSYAEGISQVLINCKRFFVKDYNIFLVANDKYGLYPVIAKKAGMRIVEQFKRPVLNRTEKDKGAYSEMIFHLKEK